MGLSEETIEARPEGRSRTIALRASVVVLVLAFFGFVFGATLGPPISVDTLSCKVEEEPKVSHTRRNISYSVETSCGKLGLTPESYFSARLKLEAGESYSFTVENRIFGRKAVAFEAL